MNSVQMPATVIFSALLVIILLSASRTTYTLAPAKERTALVACAVPTLMREAAERRVCPWPSTSRRSHHWPADAALDSAAPGHSPEDTLDTDALTARAVVGD
jgi:hypothetical protein